MTRSSPRQGMSSSKRSADLKRLIEDGKLLFANDKVKGFDLRPATEYYLDAVREVRINRQRYAEAEAQARKQRPARPWMLVGPGQA